MKNKTLIAITGGIGSGKSYALDLINKRGYLTLSCDTALNEVYQDKSALKEIKNAFPNVFDGDILNRKKLSQVVFNDKPSLNKLNSITHPRILEKVISQAKQSEDSIVFIEVPLLFEGNFQTFFNKVLVIRRDINSRIESVKKRSDLTEEQILKRINNQIDYDNYDFNGYDVIINDNLFEDKIYNYLNGLI